MLQTGQGSERPTTAAKPDVTALVEGLRRTFEAGRTRPAAWRKAQLRALDALLADREQVFLDALAADMGRARFEGWLAETSFVRNEIKHTLGHLAEWMKPARVPTTLANLPGRSFVMSEPYGVALIIGAWNYPVQLTLAPLVGAIAAGNAAVVKPSELSPHTAAALAEWIPKYLDESAIRVVVGGVAESQALLRERFDTIFFTGGERVGRIVMEAAARHLTPVTLELGGKSPCYVDRNVDLAVTARRIVWGKFFNAGQTCIAPDYVLVHRDVEERFLERVAEEVRTFYGENPKASPDFARIVDDRHFQRLTSLLEGQEPVVGGQADAEARYIAPTVLRGVRDEDPVMQEEIFGPILPVITVDDANDAIERIRKRPRPLALYVFSKDRRVQRRMLEQTSSGGVCINDVMAHVQVPELPFGGVGASGMGAYHGRASFDVFSHKKGVLHKGTRVDPSLRYPPYDENKEKWAKRLI